MGLAEWLGNGKGGGQRRSLRSHLLQDPYYRLQPADIPLAAKLGIKIDANQAGVDDWLRLPGFSIHQAGSLVALRQSGVAFHCLEDIAAALSVPVQRLQPLAPVLQFCYYDEESAIAIQPISANTASMERLTQIPGVDLFLARAIVEQRRLGAYRNMADLQRRLELPGQMTAEIMHYLQF